MENHINDVVCGLTTIGFIWGVVFTYIFMTYCFDFTYKI